MATRRTIAGRAGEISLVERHGERRCGGCIAALRLVQLEAA